MLQKVDKDRLEKVLEVIQKRSIRFPNAAIVKALKEDKGNVSSYLNGKKPMPDNFYTTFMREFDVATPKTDYITKRRDLKNSDKKDELVFYEIGANAGLATAGEILPVKKGEGKLHISDLFKGSQYAIRISGNSMTPNYPPGAIIGIREVPDKQITPGSVYVIEKESDLWIKRLYYRNDNSEIDEFECISDNTMKIESGARQGKLAYPAFFIKIDTIRRLFKVTGIYKPNELTVIN